MDVTRLTFDSDSVGIRATSLGTAPPTVSSPDIHFTTTVDARTLIYPDTIVFLAYNKAFEKRLLHPIRLKERLTLTEPRRLYSNESPTSDSTATVLDLLKDKFDSDDPASISIIHPWPGFAKHYGDLGKLQALHKEFQDMSNDLPWVPLHVGFWAFPAEPSYHPHDMPQILRITGEPTDKVRKGPVVLAGQYLPDFT